MKIISSKRLNTIIEVLFLFSPLILFFIWNQNNYPLIMIGVAIYNDILLGLLLTSAIVIFTSILRILFLKLEACSFYNQRLKLLEILLYFIAILIISNLFHTPLAIVFALLISFAYFLSFLIKMHWFWIWSRRKILVVLFGISCLSYLLTPAMAALFFILHYSIRRNFVHDLKSRGIVIVLWIISLSVISTTFLSMRVIPMSSSASRILNFSSLYDCQIDPVKQKLLVSTKNFKAKSNLLFTFLLNDPAAPPGRYVIPTDEFENFELDPVKRKIYHIDRNDITTTSSNREKQPLKLLEIDADDFNVIQSTDIKHKCTGSLNHALFGSLGVLIASCENNYLFSIDLDSIDILATICPNQYISIIADTLNNLVYLDLGSHTMEARDAKTLALRKSVAGPYYAEKMSISYNRKELYVPAGYESEVWVYSIPDLNLKKKIKTQFGQRALAVDEKNNLLIAASGITGYIDVIDLDSEKRLQRHYVAKYGRTLILDTDRRNAFMTTTNDGLFMLKY